MTHLDPARAIEILERQRAAIDGLRASRRSPEFTKWKRDTEVAVQRIFGADSRHSSDFSDVRYSLGVFHSGTTDHEFHAAYIRGLENAKSILSSMIDEIREYEIDGLSRVSQSATVASTLGLLEKICLRFHMVARQLRVRHASRKTLEIEDEYDVQDLLHALLKLHFDDVRAEEWTPSYAGGSARADFLLKEEGIVLELKKTRQGLGVRDIGDQLLIDIAKYQEHPNCEQLVCFIYDPEGRIGNPVGLERDLEKTPFNVPVRVIVGPKGT
jgi:hypothetical protein